MQVYKYMDIGTAKPTQDEMQGVPHYLIDELMPDEEFSAAVFQTRAKKYIAEIAARGGQPIITGGTGFYINGLLFDNDFTESDGDPAYRAFLFGEAEAKGADYIHGLLRAADPEAAEAIHPNNVKRVVRALEYNKLTNGRISEHNAQQKQKQKQKQMHYDAALIILYTEREQMYRRINERVDQMLSLGLVDEVRRLLDMGYAKNISMLGIGYKEIAEYLTGNVSLDAAVETLKKNTRHFAKRQLTWFRHQCDGLWINIDEFNNKDIIVDKILKEKGVQTHG